MKVPLSWLKEFVDLSATPTQIAQILTQAGIEVEGIDRANPGFTKVVVGHVLGTTPHPNADKLCIAQVTDGSETYQVVCGAPNCRPGIKTALALIGAELSEEEGKTFKVKKSKIRGEESFGMLCSGKELGISNEDEGILEFAEHMKEGIDLGDLYSEVIFDVALTPNLSHATSMVGISRELSAALKQNLNWPKPITLNEVAPAISEKVKIVVQEPELCPRYGARMVEGIQVGPSPEWLKKRIESCGLRSINNVVDVTNLILLEVGHPLHAFDLDKIQGDTLFVRLAKEGETCETLDGKPRVLESSMLLIADQKQALAIAGVMGGASSQVTESTTNILIEAAYFDPSSIRKTSKKLQLQSDSSRRFERGTDPNQVESALDRAAFLIQEVAGGNVRQGRIIVQAREFPEKEIACRLSRINQILGTRLSVDEVEKIFLSLGFKVDYDGQDVLAVKVPTFRVDVNQEIDLVEEAARLWGYDNIPREPARFQSTRMPHAPAYLFEKEVRRKLVAEGLQEFINCDLIGPSLFKVAYGTEETPKGSIAVLNPVSVEQSVLRISLLPGLLQVVKHNYDRECRDIAGFEIGRVHFKDGDKLPENMVEQTVLAVILSGKSSPSAYDPKPHALDFRDLKGIIENLLRGLGIENYTCRRSSLTTLHPGKQASIFVGGLEIGTLGEIHPSIQRSLDMLQPIYYAELNLLDLFRVRKQDSKMKALPVFPASERDWTVTLIEKASVQQVLDAIKATPSSLLEEVKLVAVYRSPSLGKNKKNVTFNFIYRDNNKTVEQAKVDQEHARITESALQLISGCLPTE